MRLGRIILMHCQSTVVHAIVDFVVQCFGRRCIHHVPAKSDVIGCNNFTS